MEQYITSTEILELTSPPEPKDFASRIRKGTVRKLIINYEYDPSPCDCDYFSHIDENGDVSECSNPRIVPFTSPFAGIRLKNIPFPIEIGPRCTSLRGLFAGHKELRKISAITGTEHVRCFNYMFSDCFHLAEPPRLDLSSAVSCVGLYSGCHRLVSPEFTGGDLVENCSGMFEFCYRLGKAPDLFFPACKITSGMFDSCVSLKKIPSYYFPEVRDCACMFQDCIRMRCAPAMSMPKAVNFIQMFNNCRSLGNVPPFIFRVARNNTTSLLLCCFDGCPSLDMTDVRFLLRNCPDALLSWKDAVLDNQEMKKAIADLRKRRKHENHHWLSNIAIFTVLLLATAWGSVKFWHSQNSHLENEPAKTENPAAAASGAGVISRSEARRNAAIMDVREIIENYTTRCRGEHITFDRYTNDILLKSVTQIGLYGSRIYRHSGGYALLIANRDAAYISDTLVPGDDVRRIILMKPIALDSPEAASLSSPSPDEDVTLLKEFAASLQPVLSDTDVFIPGADGTYTLTRFKYKKMTADLSFSPFYQYAAPDLLRETDTGRFLVALPLEGHYYYLDEHNQISDERLKGCFEIQQGIYDAMSHGLTYRQALALEQE